MLFIQILLLLFFAFVIYKTIKRALKGEVKKEATVLWVVFWLIAAFATVNPNSTALVAGFLGLGRGADAVIYVSLALLFFLFFGLTVKLEKINREITHLVRQQALKEFKKNTENKFE